MTRVNRVAHSSIRDNIPDRRGGEEVGRLPVFLHKVEIPSFVGKLRQHRIAQEGAYAVCNVNPVTNVSSVLQDMRIRCIDIHARKARTSQSEPMMDSESKLRKNQMFQYSPMISAMCGPSGTSGSIGTSGGISSHSV